MRFFFCSIVGYKEKRITFVKQSNQNQMTTLEINTAKVRHQRQIKWLEVAQEARRLVQSHTQDRNLFEKGGMTSTASHHQKQVERFSELESYAIKRYEIC